MAYFAKKIENSYVVWFQASNQWVIFDEVKWLVFKLFEDNISARNTSAKIQEDFSIPAKEAEVLVNNVYKSARKLLNPDFALPEFEVSNEKVTSHVLKNKKTFHYTYNKKSFAITYANPKLAGYIHLPLKHLETKFRDDITILNIDVFPLKNRFYLRINNSNSKKTLSAENSGQIKRLLYIELVNYFYNMEENDWLAFIHASAVEKNNDALLLTSPGGYGKSTMTALLLLNGYNFLADDFVPVSSLNLKAYPFPAALSLKNDSVKIMESKGLPANKTKGSIIAYANHRKLNNSNSMSAVKNVVFIKYDPATEVMLKPVSKIEALTAFHPEAWVGNDMKRAKLFVEWFENVDFYKLNYGDNDKAVKAIDSLF